MLLRRNSYYLPALVMFGAALISHSAAGQVIAPAFAGSYTIIFNGSGGNVPGPYGGIIFKAGDPNTILLGGAANGSGGVLYSLPVTRGGGNHITAIGATGTLVSTAPNNDGGLVYAPNGDLLFTEYSNNQIGEIKPGSASPDKTVSLPGVAASVGTLQYVPAGFGGAGKLKVLSYSSGDWYDMTLTPDGLGTYNVSTSSSQANVGGGPEGVVYVAAGNPLFSLNSLLLSEYGLGKVSVFTSDLNGNPSGVAQDFITGLSGAEGGTVDPLTGDFVFSTFGGGNKVIVVSGFQQPTPPGNGTPEPGSIAFACGLLASGVIAARRRVRGEVRLN